MNLYHLLTDEGVQADRVLVLRHRPTEPELRRQFLRLAAARPDMFNAYQSMQFPKVEKQLKRATHLASFIGHKPGLALFVGVYANGTPRMVTHSWRQRNSAYRELVTLGMQNGPDDCLWFDLQLSSILDRWRGKLVVQWPGKELSYSRWAHKGSRFNVEIIHEESILSERIPDWRTLVFSWNELENLPVSWQAALREWRGVYLIFDTRSRKAYVGSAYGENNILGRWLNYSKSGDGGNRRLKGLNPKNFRFSILERMSPDTSPDEMIARENEWKERLHTREFGLNDN